MLGNRDLLLWTQLQLWLKVGSWGLAEMPSDSWFTVWIPALHTSQRFLPSECYLSFVPVPFSLRTTFYSYCTLSVSWGLSLRYRQEFSQIWTSLLVFQKEFEWLGMSNAFKRNKVLWICDYFRIEATILISLDLKLCLMITCILRCSCCVSSPVSSSFQSMWTFSSR